ncbi:hypothetical protein FOVSG1_013510 [Fusarium oxysporum f. sp. vasinfectum]
MANPTKALFVTSQNEFKVIEKHEVPRPGDGELLIKTLFSGVNPADMKHTTVLGINNTVIGYDFCGQVLETSNRQSTYKPGDIVAGYTPSGVGRSCDFGTHQAYFKCPEAMLFKVPANLPQPDAATLSCVAMTAADAIFNCFKLPLPTELGSTKPNGPLLLWGATGAVGYCALQFAITTGVLPIFVTAQSNHFEHLRSLGITYLFDYKDPNVYESIAKALKESGHNAFAYALDAPGTPGSADQVLRATSDETQLVSTVMQENKRFVMPTALPSADFVIQPPGVPHPISIPARPADGERARKGLLWAVENYGTSFRLPPIRVMEDTSEKILHEIHRVVEQGSGFSKLAVKHPLN